MKGEFSEKVVIYPILALLAMSIPIQCTAAENWVFVIAPYALIPSIDGDTSIGRVESIDIDVGPDDILNNLELGGMLQLEAHHASGFGVIMAYNFMDLGGDATAPSGQVNLKADIYQGIFEGYGLMGLNFSIIQGEQDEDILGQLFNDKQTIQKAGLNIGAGTRFNVSDKVVPFAELRYTLGGKAVFSFNEVSTSQLSIFAGVLIRIGKDKDRSVSEDY